MTRLAAWLVSFALVACSGAPSPVAEPAPESPAAAYAGDEVCTTCHDDAATSYASTIHARVLGDSARPEPDRGCEACHGPGSVHAEEGGGKGVGGLRAFVREEPASTRAAACLRCHGGRSALHDFLAGEHAISRVACTDCHAMHAPKADPLLARATPELCYGCHQDVRAAFAMPEHHKVPEGVVSCIDCHQPHGSRNTAGLRDADDRTCFRCHAEIQGPYVFEHGAQLTEGCTRCHDPHGSVNRHLLIRQQVAQLCYECHTVTPTTHVQPSYRDCTRCHAAIHGSNTDPRFLAP
ncbi:MAG: DmsE family decaheme c-type cytochrome [Candidatus Binatia bacterium]